jgi:hypothetical protein
MTFIIVFFPFFHCFSLLSFAPLTSILLCVYAFHATAALGVVVCLCIPRPPLLLVCCFLTHTLTPTNLPLDVTFDSCGGSKSVSRRRSRNTKSQTRTGEIERSGTRELNCLDLICLAALKIICRICHTANIHTLCLLNSVTRIVAI